MNVLFWNTYRNSKKDNIDKCLTALIIEKMCDIIILAEYGETSHLRDLINIASKDNYIVIPNHGGCNKIKGLINSKYNVESICEQTRYQIIKVKTTSYVLLIGMIHNESKLHSSEQKQAENLRIFHEDICRAEKEFNTSNTMVIGDFNSSPFENACISAVICGFTALFCSFIFFVLLSVKISGSSQL